jgi:DNA-binding response OmpR family regulator
MSGAQRTVLAVDDEHDIIEMLVLLLESEGYRVLTASGGREAMDILRTERPDLVLLDIMMPEIDGHQVCRYVRAQQELAEVPVLMLTAKNDIEHIAQSLDEGADGFIVKPFDVDQFLRLIEFRLAGAKAEFYRSDRPVVHASERAPDQLADRARIVFLDLIEPESPYSAVVGACQDQTHCVMSLWQREAEGDQMETTVLLGIDSSAQFGDVLNRVLEVPDVRIVNCIIYRDFDDIPIDIMHGGNDGVPDAE